METLKVFGKINTAPEKGVLLILRIGTALQIALTAIFLIFAAITHRSIRVELSSILTLIVSLSVAGFLVYHPDAQKRLSRSYFLPILISFQTLISLALPLLFTSQVDRTDFFIAFWLLIPSAFIPLAIVALQYSIVTTFFFTLITNLLDFVLMIHIQLLHYGDVDYVIAFIQDGHLLRNLLLRFIFMTMMGHILSVLVLSIRKNSAQLEQANRELEELNQHLEERVHERTQALESTNEKTLDGWVRLMELRHLEPTGHTQRMSALAKDFNIKLGLSKEQIEILHTTIRLHDVGKLGIPDHILLKPSSLSQSEFEQAKLHVEYSRQILEGIDFLKPSISAIAAHHEHWNGSGYPRGIREREIPFLARVFSVIEVYDVLTHDTIYRKAWSKHHARKYLLENSGILFDPLVVTQFLGLLETQDLDKITKNL